jgi:hypothetical protein
MEATKNKKLLNLLFVLARVAWYGQWLLLLIFSLQAARELFSFSPLAIQQFLKDNTEDKPLMWLSGFLPRFSFLLYLVGGLILRLALLWMTKHIHKLIGQIRQGVVFSLQNLAHCEVIIKGMILFTALKLALTAHFEVFPFLMAAGMILFTETFRHGYRLHKALI